MCFHRYWNVYLDENKEMWVALHLSACKLQAVVLFPAVMVVAGEALWELQTGEKKKVKTLERWLKQEYTAHLLWNFRRDGSNVSFVFEFIYMRRLKKKKFQSSTLSELMKRLRVFNVYHGKPLHKHPDRLKKIKTSLSFTLTFCVHQASYLLT